MATRSDENEAYEIALRLLAPREHSRYELAEKLRLRGVDRLSIQSVLERLIQEGYQSDERYVENCVRVRLRKGDGPIKIRSYLHERGISGALISGHISDDDEFWYQRALEGDQKCRLKHRFTSERAREYDAMGTRARFLKNRGYPTNIIIRVLETVT